MTVTNAQPRVSSCNLIFCEVKVAQITIKALNVQTQTNIGKIALFNSHYVTEHPGVNRKGSVWSKSLKSMPKGPLNTSLILRP